MLSEDQKASWYSCLSGSAWSVGIQSVFFAHIGVLYFEQCWLEGQTGPKPWEKYKVGSLWARFGRVKSIQNILPRNRECHVFSRRDQYGGVLGGHRVRAVVFCMWSVILVCVHCDGAFVCI